MTAWGALMRRPLLMRSRGAGGAPAVHAGGGQGAPVDHVGGLGGHSWPSLGGS